MEVGGVSTCHALGTTAIVGSDTRRASRGAIIVMTIIVPTEVGGVCNEARGLLTTIRLTLLWWVVLGGED